MRWALLVLVLVGCGGSVDEGEEGGECVPEGKSCLTVDPCCPGLVCVHVEGGSMSCLAE
jgi:hypothetical protein